MTVLDVGQGLAVVVETHRSRARLRHRPALHATRPTPAGGSSRRFCAPRASAALPGMIVTHQDSDHSGGALTLLQTVPGGLVRLVAARGACHSARARGRRRESGAVRSRAASGRGTTCASRCCSRPPRITRRRGLKPNDLSCVVRIESDHGSVLLTGDLEARGEQELVRRDPAALKADVLLVPHHGSRTSSTPAFIAAVAPDIAVYTPGYRNRFGHPRPDIVARYDGAGIRATGPISMARSRSPLDLIRHTRRGPSASTTAATGTTRRCVRDEAAHFPTT